MASTLPAPPYYPALTGLRGIAAVWVALYHGWQAAGSPTVAIWVLDLTPVLACGYFGVDLFFVLSGFLLGAPFLHARLHGSPPPSLARFWRQRIRRVMPAFLAQVLILSLLTLLASGTLPLAAHQYPVYLLLLFNLQEGFPLLNPVHWSLPVEWNFYFILPLLALCFPSTGGWRLPLALSLAFALVCRFGCWYALERYGVDGLEIYRWIIQLPARVDQFVFGMTAALWVTRGHGTKVSLWIGAAGTTLLIGMIFAAAPRGDIFGQADWPWLLWHYPVLGSGLALIIMNACMPGTLLAKVLGSRKLGSLGLMSYSLYLWHFPALSWIGTAPPALPPGSLQWWLAYAAIVLVCSRISFSLFEKPFHRPGATLSRSTTGGGNAAAAAPQ